MHVSIDVAQTIWAIGGIVVLVAVLFFNETAYKRLLRLLWVSTKALATLIRLLDKLRK